MSIKDNKNGNRYHDDFRKIIVVLYQLGQKVKDLSSEYGVSEDTIYSWSEGQSANSINV